MTATIDLLDAAAFVGGQPHDQFAWLRDNDPVHWHDEPDGPGFFAVTRYEDVKRIGRDPQTFSSVGGIMIPGPTNTQDPGRGAPRMMISMDPPDHGAYRRMVIPDFIPKAVKAMAPRVVELATKIIDGVIERGECDLVTDVAGLMPSYVIAEMLGLPHADGVALYDLTERIHSTPQPGDTSGGSAGAVMEMLQYANAVWQDRQTNPRDDLSTKLAQVVLDGEPLSPMDFGMWFLLLVDAGGDTTRNLVATGLHSLLEHPEQMQLLRDDLDGLNVAIEELLRWVSPVVYMRRTATRDVSLHDKNIAAGQKVVMYYGAANRDPSVFRSPDALDITRWPNEHVAFGGGGPHFCIGAHLGRAEIQAMLREILTRLEGLRVAEPPSWLPSTFISGVQHMPVEFTPGARLAS